MFHKRFKQTPFVSNPPLPDLPVSKVMYNSLGSPVTVIDYQPQSCKSIFEGSHYDPATMSLRSKLNLGISLSPVSLGRTENDPTILHQLTTKFEQQVLDFEARTIALNNSKSE